MFVRALHHTAAGRTAGKTKINGRNKGRVFGPFQRAKGRPARKKAGDKTNTESKR